MQKVGWAACHNCTLMSRFDPHSRWIAWTHFYMAHFGTIPISDARRPIFLYPFQRSSCSWVAKFVTGNWKSNLESITRRKLFAINPIPIWTNIKSVKWSSGFLTRTFRSIAVNMRRNILLFKSSRSEL